MAYDHQNIERKWQEIWRENQVHTVHEDSSKKKRKMYVLDMFPYPSADGLHVGHPLSYIATDITSRYWRMRGKHVLHPMGWDAFGLPAENYAVKTGTHPAETTKKSIANFKRQLQVLGFSYDWSRELSTADPTYYRWTQWLFLLLYKNGLAYKKKAPVNWCPSCQTVLANEQVVEGVCERCSTEVVQKELTQWFFKITDYAERLLTDIDRLDWPERIKDMQRNWIGKSEGATLKFQILHSKFHIDVFTTRADTLFGATYLVLAPEHPAVAELKKQCKNTKDIDRYVAAAQKKTTLQRTAFEKEKTGVALEGVFAINPATQKEIPVWIADYVLASYGTGAIMAVPAHDERDFAFAKKFTLPITVVIIPRHGSVSREYGTLDEEEKIQYYEKEILKKPFTDDGLVVNSSSTFHYLKSKEAKKKITEFVRGEEKIHYRIRDWLVSRQRYWGAPIPIIYCRRCWENSKSQTPNPKSQMTVIDGKEYAMIPVSEKDLPVELPTDVDFQPTGESPLARSKSFHNVQCPKCGAPARRESDTMDTFVDSSWYFLRYCDPKNATAFADTKKVEYWNPVDLYVGGAEHAVLHLLYARFFTKVLFDLTYVSFGEPFMKLRNQGMILGENGQKMSKSRGNVINPDAVVEEFGADTMRLYEMFMGPLEDAKPWSTDGMKGVHRFLQKVWKLFREAKSHIRNNTSKTHSQSKIQNAKLDQLLHQTIKKVSEDIEEFKFNTAISAMMIFINNASQHGGQLSKVNGQMFLKLLAPFAPHIAEELWEKLGHKKSIFLEEWPMYDETVVREERVQLVIQVDGRVRDRIEVDARVSEKDAEKLALASKKVQKWTEGKKVQRVIVVQGKLVNIVIL